MTKLGTTCAFLKNGACSKTMMNVLDKEFDNPMPTEEHASFPLAGGLMQGYQCGMIWGATLAAGAEAYRTYGPGARAEEAAMRAARRIVASFRALNGKTDCLDITDTDPRNGWQVFYNFFVKGGTVRCIKRAVDYAPVAFRAIQEGLADADSESPCHPESCAAKLARRMGASERHAVMAAGLAGGIGFSGGACGALGAAMWLLGMRGREDRIEEVMDRFLKATDYEVECERVVGRKFESVQDHAFHLATGGCEAVLEALAAEGGNDEDPR
jgi:hypothetical protein